MKGPVLPPPPNIPDEILRFQIPEIPDDYTVEATAQEETGEEAESGQEGRHQYSIKEPPKQGSSTQTIRRKYPVYNEQDRWAETEDLVW